MSASGEKGSGFTIAADIGGTHITTSAVRAGTGERLPKSRHTERIAARGKAGVVLEGWCASIEHSMIDDPELRLCGIGIAMPGPFDYDAGISRIRQLNKYDSLYGLNIRSELRKRLHFASGVPIIFRNDAVCFLLGEAWRGAAAGANSAIGLTLGTGFGSAFIRNGEIVSSGPDVPADGYLYHLPWKGGLADEWFSARGIMRRYRAAGGTKLKNVRELAENQDDEHASCAFVEFAQELAEFLRPWIRCFRPEIVVIGGNISRAWDLFAGPLQEEINAHDQKAEIRQTTLFEDAALLGAGKLPLQFKEPETGA